LPSIIESSESTGSNSPKRSAPRPASRARLCGWSPPQGHDCADGRSQSAGEPVDEPHALARPARAGASPAGRLKAIGHTHRGAAGRGHLRSRCKLRDHSAPPDGGQWERSKSTLGRDQYHRDSSLPFTPWASGGWITQRCVHPLSCQNQKLSSHPGAAFLTS
jgi:hypothetical protein